MHQNAPDLFYKFHSAMPRMHNGCSRKKTAPSMYHVCLIDTDPSLIYPGLRKHAPLMHHKCVRDVLKMLLLLEL